MDLPTVFSSTDLELLHQQLEALRQAQSGRRRLPAALWVAAADLARIHSPSHVARDPECWLALAEAFWRQSR